MRTALSTQDVVDALERRELGFTDLVAFNNAYMKLQESLGYDLSRVRPHFEAFTDALNDTPWKSK